MGMPRPQLFLDCDGVLADFDAESQLLFGEMPRNAEARHGTEEFWRRIVEHGSFYQSLPLMPGARKLFDAVAHLRPIILTGCPPGDWAAPQKKEWARQHFPGTTMITCLSKDKRMHMEPGDILIDDYLKYRHLWEENGGLFIHFQTVEQALEELKAVLKDDFYRTPEPR